MLRLLLSFFPELTESVYSRGIFQLVRYLFDYTLGLLPFTVIELTGILLLGWMGWRLFRFIRNRGNRSPGTFWQKSGRVVHRAGAFVGAVIFLFYFLWGFNYLRQPVADRLELTVVAPDSTLIREEFERATFVMTLNRAAIPNAGETALTSEALPEDVETLIREDLKAVLTATGYPTPGRVRGRKWFPPGLLRRFGPIGIYIPFTGEGTIDGSLLPMRLPSVMAHEMAHGYGFGDEGTCNFWAWLAMTRSPNALFRYSGSLSYWRYIGAEYRRLYPADYKEKVEELPPGIRADLQAMRENALKYRWWGSRMGSRVNNLYLKAQGIKEGVENYNKMILLVHAWQRKHGRTPLIMP